MTGVLLFLEVVPAYNLLNSRERPPSFIFHFIPNSYGCPYSTLSVTFLQVGPHLLWHVTVPLCRRRRSGPICLHRIEKGLAVEPQYGFSRNPLTVSRNTSPAKVPSSNVPYWTPTI